MDVNEKAFVEGVVSAMYEYTVGRKNEYEAFADIRSLTRIYCTKCHNEVGHVITETPAE